MSQYPERMDNDWNLYYKIASNYYDLGVSKGISGLNAPRFNDTIEELLKKIAYYTASSVG